MPERITRADVAHVAQLARLELTDDEIDLYTEQLGAILDNAAAMTQLDTTGVPATMHPVPLTNVFRDDEPGLSLDRDEVLREAGAVESGRFLVPPILDDST